MGNDDHRRMDGEEGAGFGRFAAELMDAAPDAFYALDRDWRFVFANDAACRIWGAPRDSLIGRVLWERFPEIAAAEAGAQLRAAVESGRLSEYETFSPVLRHRIRLRVCPLRGGLTGVWWHDATPAAELEDRHRADQDHLRLAMQALRESEERFRRVFEQSPLGKATAGNDFRFREVNPALCNMLGYTADELMQRSFLDLAHEEDRANCLRHAQAMAAGEIDRFQIEERFYRKSGEPIWVRVSVAPIRDAEGRILYTLGIIEDIDERKRAERALRELNETLEQQVEQRATQLAASRARLRAFFDVSPDWLTLQRVRPDGSIFYDDLNPATEAAYGLPREQVIGRTVEEVLGEEPAQLPLRHFRECIRTGLPQRYVARRTMAGRTRTIDVVFVLAPGADEGGDRFIITIARDITEREELEAQLRQAQKMEAVGQITGGIAHDFNNLLTAVIASLDLASRQTDLARVRRLTDTALRAATRGAQLTQQLLSFARRQTLSPVVLDLNALIREALPLLQRAVGEAIEIELKAAPDLWPCEVDMAQVEAALMNLAVNARDAMPEGGRITISTENAVLPGADPGAGLPAGQYVGVVVRDTGAGMPEDVLAHAFEPFFTTKDVGKGSGLGLPMVQGFVTQSGGAVRVESAPGAGTAVRIWLPRAAAVHPAPPAGKPGNETLPDSAGTILVVEDDEDVRHVAVQVLTACGLRVLEAPHGRAGLDMLRQHPEIDLLVSDVVMPGGLTGLELSREARRLRPGIGVLLISGYVAEGARDGLDFPLLAKPFRPAELAERVARLLRDGGEVRVG